MSNPVPVPSGCVMLSRVQARVEARVLARVLTWYLGILDNDETLLRYR